MTLGETLTRATVWLSISCYATGRALMGASRARGAWVREARLAWTLGCLLFLTHVACAFNYFHHWSHSAAFEETAAQTRDLTGVRWGWGLYLNYLFAVAWTVDTLWWWLYPAGFARRSPRLSGTWHFFMFFMVFNGTVVFGRGPIRWYGALICGSLAVRWLFGKKASIAEAGAAP